MTNVQHPIPCIALNLHTRLPLRIHRTVSGTPKVVLTEGARSDSPTKGGLP